MDTLGCGLMALHYPACTKLLGPTVPGMTVHNGARVPGTRYELDPVAAAFNIGCIIRWLDFNDTWLAAEWGHPSDNLGAILGVTDYLSRQIDSGAAFTLAPTGGESRSEAARKKPLHHSRGPHRDDQGARDPGHPRARKQLQPRRPRPRAARPHRVHRRRHATPRRHARPDHQRRLQRLGRWRRAPHLSPRAEHRFPQISGAAG